MCENKSWQPPKWLTDSYLENALKKYLNDKQVKLLNFDIQPATANGENYASIMSRIKATFSSSKSKTQPLFLILKYTYESDPFVAKIMNGYDVYNTEMKMYEQILPHLAEILKEVGDEEKFYANTLKVDYEKSAILFEDLTKYNYLLADRLKGLNEEHARLVLRKLAKFHTAGVVLNQRLNGELEQFQRGIFNRHTRAFGCFFEYMIENCAEFAKTCPQLGTYYHDKLIKLKPFVVDYGIAAQYNQSNEFLTLTHGDLWINNMMMQYDDVKNLKDALLLDFQLCSWGSPAVDLHYFLNTSLEIKLQLDIDCLDGLIKYYHKILTETLKILKYEGYVPTLHKLRIQLERAKFLAVTATLASQAVMISDQCDDADFHSLVDNDERARNFRAGTYNNKRLQTILKTKLPYFDCMGLLDVQK